VAYTVTGTVQETGGRNTAVPFRNASDRLIHYEADAISTSSGSTLGVTAPDPGSSTTTAATNVPFPTFSFFGFFSALGLFPTGESVPSAATAARIASSACSSFPSSPVHPWVSLFRLLHHRQPCLQQSRPGRSQRTWWDKLVYDPVKARFQGLGFTPLLFHTRAPNVAPEIMWIVLYGVSHSLGGCPFRSNGSATGIEKNSVGCSGCVARFLDGDRGLEDAGGASEGTASGGDSFFGTAVAGAAGSWW